jgi:hypothetical protein
MTPIEDVEKRAMEFDRAGFQQRASAVLKDDLDRNGRITPDGIAMVGAEAEFYARRAISTALSSSRADALEEAAKVADGYLCCAFDDGFVRGANATKRDIAAGIRSLISTPQEQAC